VALPARDALARCLGRPRIGIDEDPATTADWVAEWYGAFTQRRGGDTGAHEQGGR
jgi:hypothetical protein